MLTILLIYLISNLLLIAFSRWLDNRQTEKAFKDAERLYRHKTIELASMPNPEILAQIRGNHHAY